MSRYAGPDPIDDSLSACIAAVETSLVRSGRLGDGTLANRLPRIRRFGSYLAAHGVDHLDAASEGHVRGFMESRRANGVRPTDSERRSRLSAAQLTFREARALGLASTDPTVDIKLPSREYVSARPLSDVEVEAARPHAVRRSDLRPAVCWALAEATATTSEMPNARASNADLEQGNVYLHGGATTDPRLVPLTAWGITQLRRRLDSVTPEEGHDPILMIEGRWDHPDEGRAAATMALIAVLKSARLSAPGVNPRSIRAWAGAKALADGMSIDEVARLLGVRSLDQAAAIVGFDWREASR
jgi:integrase/recombinase XerC